MGLFSGIAKIFGLKDKPTLDEELRAELADRASQQPQMEAVPQLLPGEYSIVLDDAGSSPISVIKLVKDRLGLGLKEAKNLVDGTPSVLIRDVDMVFANQLVRALEAAGAQARLERP